MCVDKIVPIFIFYLYKFCVSNNNQCYNKKIENSWKMFGKTLYPVAHLSLKLSKFSILVQVFIIFVA